jgi:hypothetical protein
MDVDPAMVACLPVLRGFEPRGIGRTLKTRRPTATSSLEMTKLLAMGHKDAGG